MRICAQGVQRLLEEESMGVMRMRVQAKYLSVCSFLSSPEELAQERRVTYYVVFR